MEYGVRSIECGVRSTRVWSTEYTSMEYGVLSVEYGVREYGVRSTAPELGVHGLWSMEYCRWRNPCQGPTHPPARFPSTISDRKATTSIVTPLPTIPITPTCAAASSNARVARHEVVASKPSPVVSAARTRGWCICCASTARSESCCQRRHAQHVHAHAHAHAHVHVLDDPARM